MHGSATVGWMLTALCAVTSGACLLRARGAGGMQRRTAGSEAFMGVAMAVMALSGSVPVAVPPLAFVVPFGAVAAWELALLRESSRAERPAVHHVHHLVGALAMVYMAVAMQAAHGSSGHAHGTAVAAAGVPLLTGALLTYFAAYVLWAGLRLLPVPAEASASGAGAGPLWGGCAVRDLPALATACRLAMATGMLAMLLML
jgi:hypothetical protein